MPELISEDWMTAFLESYVQPHLELLRIEFQREYLQVYDEWSRHPIHAKCKVVTSQIEVLLQIADEHMASVSSRYRIRVLLHALRSIPLGVIGWLCGTSSAQSVTATIIVATQAIRRSGQLVTVDNPSLVPGYSWIEMSPLEYETFRRHLGTDLAMLLGAAFAAQMAEACYRLAGKGGELTRPIEVPQYLWSSVNNHSPVILPEPHLEASAEILEAIRLFEDRRDAYQFPAHSGLVSELGNKLGSIAFPWWVFAIAATPEQAKEIRITYPALDKTFVTASYWMQACDAERFIRLFDAFETLLRQRTGLTSLDLIACCRALFFLVGEQTGYWHLTTKPETEDAILLEFNFAAERKIVLNSALHLFGSFSRGYLRAPRKSFVNGIAYWLRRNDRHPDPEDTANQFVERFTETKITRGLFQPVLFYFVDSELLVLDGLLMVHFLDACLRVATTGDGAPGNLRGSVFEEQARDEIIAGLGLTESNIPYPISKDLIIDGTNYGDVDFAFLIDDLVINLDMKAWQTSEKYFRGDFLAIDNRQKTLSQYLTQKVSPRGQKLLDLTEQRLNRKLRGVTSILCVPAPEYISPYYRELWNQNTPLVLAPDEIVRLYARP